MDFRVFLLQIVLKIIVIINIVILNDIVATLQFLNIKVYQVTEKQFSTQFQWKDKINKHLHIIQSCAWKQKVKWPLFSKFPNSVLNWRSRHQAVLPFIFDHIAAMYLMWFIPFYIPPPPIDEIFLMGCFWDFLKGSILGEKFFWRGLLPKMGANNKNTF